MTAAIPNRFAFPEALFSSRPFPTMVLMIAVADGHLADAGIVVLHDVNVGLRIEASA